MDLQDLVDAHSIEQTIIRYFDRIDALDPFGAASVFAEDATADLMTGKVYQGRDSIGRALARILLQYRHTSHHVSNHRSEIDGDDATSLTYIYAFHRFPDDRIWHLWCRNFDRFRRVDGVWQIAERVLIPLDSDPPWELIDDDWYMTHPGRKTHDELRAELEASYASRDR